MRRSLLALLFVACAGRADAAIVLRGHVDSPTGTSNANTTAAVDTTTCGSNCIFVIICAHANGATAFGASAASDNQGNTYTPAIADIAAPASVHTRTYYALGVTTNASTTFTCTQSGQFPSVSAAFADGVAQSSPVDVTGSSTNQSSPMNVPTSALNGAASGELMIGGFGMDGAAGPSSVTHSDSGALSSDLVSQAANHYALGGAYAVLNSSADQVSWTYSGGANQAGSIVFFKAASGAVDTTPPFTVIGSRPFSTPNIMYGPHVGLIALGLAMSTAATVAAWHVVNQVILIVTALNAKHQRRLEMQRRAARDAMLERFFAQTETREHALIQRQTKG